MSKPIKTPLIQIKYILVFVIFFKLSISSAIKTVHLNASGYVQKIISVGTTVKGFEYIEEESNEIRVFEFEEEFILNSTSNIIIEILNKSKNYKWPLTIYKNKKEQVVSLGIEQSNMSPQYSVTVYETLGFSQMTLRPSGSMTVLKGNGKSWK